MAIGRRILLMACALGCSGVAYAQNLIVNGDFEEGNVGFLTDFIYSPGDIWLNGTYDVVHDVSDVHPVAELYHDHTTGTGLMMAANGALPDRPIVWSQTVTVTPGVLYKFVAWAANWAHGSQWHMAPLEFRINGTPVAFWISTVVGQWFLVSANWDAGAATTAVVTIVDLSEEWDGNDPALDDLWLALLGDLNCDGSMDIGDVNPFVMSLLDPVGYHAQFAGCNILGGDINGDGVVNSADINPFVTLLIEGSLPMGACCLPGGACIVTTSTSCTAQYGHYRGDGTTCDPNPCPSCDWTRLWPPNTPDPRLDAGLTYDSARGVLVLFGGWDGGSGHYGDTWEWGGANWTKKSDRGPSQRAPNHLAYDIARGVTVLFGGADNDRVFGDTWEWDGVNWIWRSGVGPAPRDRHGLVYDSERGVSVLFGGWAENWDVIYSDTWEWDGTRWTQRSAGGPSPRFQFGMAYDSARARTVLFGGATYYYGLDGETWEWDGTNWARMSNDGPPARWGPAMTYDADRGVCILFGGITTSGWLSDTWEWDGVHWTHRSDGGPSPRWGSNMEYDRLRGATTLFGGWSGSDPLDDTWQFACALAGACCYADGSCALTAPAECTGTWQGAGTTCDPNPCVCGDFCSLTSLPDGLVNDNDYWYIHDGLGYCAPHPSYVCHALADLDHDGCITLADYQLWVMCYRTANGEDFVVPRFRPRVAVPGAVPASSEQAGPVISLTSPGD